MPGNAEPLSPGRVPLWLKIGFTLWVAAWAPFYWSHYGPQNFLWFCDIGNLVLCVALWTESRLLFSWQAVSLLVVQSVWTFDLLGRLFLGAHLVGASEYMFNAAIPLHIRLLSLFHAATPVLMLWALCRFGYDRRALAWQSMTAWIILPVCFFFFDSKMDINWVWGPFDKAQGSIPPWLYFGLCMIGYPLVLYLPTHAAILALSRWIDNRGPSRIESTVPREPAPK